MRAALIASTAAALVTASWLALGALALSVLTRGLGADPTA